MAQEFCTENDLCSREKKKKKKKKQKKTKSDGKGKPKKGSKVPVEPGSVKADVAQKREMIEQARKRGLPPEQLREKVRRAELSVVAGTTAIGLMQFYPMLLQMLSDEFDEKLTAARARSAKRQKELR